MSTEKKILSANLFPVVGIGASAGGLEAFKMLLKAIPEKSGMAYVLVQHLAPTHESMLPELLQKVTKVPVLEILDDVKVEPDHIYILPSNKMLVANDGVLQLSPRPASKGQRNLPIDLFFTSLAEIHQDHAIGVVLSGTGSDGTQGLRAIRDNGGTTVAQDEVSAGYAGMPHSAVQAGVVDLVLPPDQIPQKLMDLRAGVDANGGSEQTGPEPENVFRQILSLLRVRRQTDFTYYKQTTIRRRIQRRIAITKSKNPVDYLNYLRADKPEQDALYQDLLIPVTSFFRDAKTFSALCETVLPILLKNKTADGPVRVWVAGCSTGQEAYSVAMCLKEVLGNRQEQVQIFASDLSEPAIKKARVGIYSASEVGEVSPQRLQEFFTKIGGGYQVNKPVRDMCVFAVHDFLKDPPFGKIDFVSCRNVLIYMESYLQKKALTTFHYALNPNGFLLLGRSETVGGVPDLFKSAAKNDKLYTRKDAPGRFMPIVNQQKKVTADSANVNVSTEPMRTDFQKTADDIILSKYTPVGVVVNEALDIVHFRGATSNYLEQLSGKPSHNLLLMAKDGLAFELRNVLHKAKKDKVPVTKENVPVTINGSLSTISIEAVPLPNTIEPHYLILFHETNSADTKPATDGKKRLAKSKKDEKDHRIEQLEQELAQTRDDMRGITEDQEVVNEELQSANEELLSGNEELQSLNEELETSKEELQSTNEELTVVNQEMIGLNEQVTTGRDYAEAIIANIREPLIVLSSKLRVQLANAAFYRTFQVGEAETEGVLIYDLGNRQWNIPELRTLLEHILPDKTTFTDFELTHTFATIGRRVMLLNAREIVNKNTSEKLILLSIEDITVAANAREAERQATKQLQFIADAMPQKVWTADGDGNVNYLNQIWLDYTGLTYEDLKSRGWEQVTHPDDWEKSKKSWQHAIDTGDDFEEEHRFLNKNGDYKWHLSRGVAHRNESGTIVMWVGTNTEINEQKEQNVALEKAVVKRTHELEEAKKALEGTNAELNAKNKELESFTYVSSHDLQEPLRKIQTLASRILDKEAQNLTDSGQDSFRRLQKAAERMQNLIRDLLAFSRLGTAERKFETIELRVVLEDVIDELNETISEKRAVVEYSELGPATVVVFQFRQLLHNLIGNALKFSDPATPPKVTIRSTSVKGSETGYAGLAAEKNYCHITVSDNGIGFDPQYSEKIFDVFQRLHGKEKYNGTGIGLAIVKRIIENHDGVITATSEPKKGTRFDIYIPAA